jgi:uncharacterized protein YbaP (TraB family)
MRLKLKLIICISVLLQIAGIAQNNEDPKEYNGLLWKITGNGLTEPSYLYGTMHVSQKLAFHLSDNFYESLESCDVVGLEINPDKWMDQIEETEFLKDNYIMAGRGNLYFSSVEFPEVKDQELASNIYTDNNLINGLLFRSQRRQDELEEETYLDLYIFQTGMRMNKELISLENFKTVNELELKAQKPIEDEEIDKERESILKKKAEKLMEKDGNLMDQMEQAYREGNLDLIDTLSQIMNFRGQYHKYMIEERNKLMAINMDSVIKSGKTLFTGVGAAHLPGKIGVIELMRDKGYKVEPLERSISGKSKKYRKKFDPIIVPSTWSLKSTDDGRIKMQLPGKLYKMPSFGSVQTLLYPDMANGTYYWVKRLKMYNYLHESSTSKDLKVRIEEMLYENIPGTINNQKNITIGGWPAIDIYNQTRKGNDQHHLIIMTPLEVIIIKMAGQDDYVTKYGNKLFESFELDYELTNDWAPVSPAEGVFSIDMPTLNLTHRMPTSYQGPGPAVEIEGADKDGNFYIARRIAYNNFYNLENDDFELKILLKNLGKEINFDSISSELFLKDGYPAIKATLKNQQGKYFHTEIIVQGNSYFILSQITKDAAPKKTYFNSFKIKDKVYESDFELHTDSSMYFTIMAPKQSEMEKLRNNYRDYYGGYSKAKDNGIKNKRFDTEINSVFTGEQIYISRERYSAMAYYENIDSLWAEELRPYTRSSFLPNYYDRYSRDYISDNKIKDSVTYTKGKFQVLDYSLRSDTSSQIIKRRLFQYRNNLYSLYYYHDSLTAPSMFCDSVFGSFDVFEDTLPSFDLFEPKRGTFHRLITSDDSLKVTQAFSFIYKADYEDEDEAVFKNYIDNFYDYFGKYEMGIEERAKLIEALKRFETKTSVAYLKDLYLANEDSVSYQISALNALADIETQESYDIIREMLLENTPIPKNSSEISYIYNRFYDTLELTTSFFPEILLLNQYYEYKDQNLRLLSTLIDRDILDPSVLSKYRKSLINDANIELKRSQADNEVDPSKKKKSYNDYGYDDYSEISGGYEFGELSSLMREMGSYSSNSSSKSSSNALEAYLKIIAQWYKKEEKVQAIFSKIERIPDNNLQMQALIELEKNGVTVYKEQWEKHANDPKQTKELFILLQTEDLLNVLDSAKLFTNEKLIESSIISKFKLDGTADLEKISSREVDSDGEIKTIYYYKIQVTNSYNNKMTYSIVSASRSEYTWKGEVSAYYYADKLKAIEEYTTPEEIQEYIDEEIEEELMEAHPRYQKPNKYGNYYGMDY